MLVKEVIAQLENLVKSNPEIADYEFGIYEPECEGLGLFGEENEYLFTVGKYNDDSYQFYDESEHIMLLDEYDYNFTKEEIEELYPKNVVVLNFK